VAPSAAVSGEWLRWTLLSKPVREDLACGSLGAAVRGVNIFDLKRVLGPLPPADEQVEIGVSISTATRQLDELSVEAQSAIDLLQERRTALISAAVTGQIDVRALSDVRAA